MAQSIWNSPIRNFFRGIDEEVNDHRTPMVAGKVRGYRHFTRWGVSMGGVTKSAFLAELIRAQSANYESNQSRCAVGLGQLQRLERLFNTFGLTTDPLYQTVSAWANETTYRALSTTKRAAGTDYWKGNLVVRVQGKESDKEWGLLDDFDVNGFERQTFFVFYSLNEGLFHDSCWLDRWAIPEPAETIQAFQGPPPMGRPHRLNPSPRVEVKPPAGNSTSPGLGWVAALGVFFTSRAEYLLKSPHVSIDEDGNIVLSLQREPSPVTVGSPNTVRAYNERNAASTHLATTSPTNEFAEIETLNDEQLCHLLKFLLLLLLRPQAGRVNFIRVNGSRYQPDDETVRKAIEKIREVMNKRHTGNPFECLFQQTTVGRFSVSFCPQVNIADTPIDQRSIEHMFNRTMRILMQVYTQSQLSDSLRWELAAYCTLLIHRLGSLGIDRLGMLRSLIRSVWGRVRLFPSHNQSDPIWNFISTIENEICRQFLNAPRQFPSAIQTGARNLNPTSANRADRQQLIRIVMDAYNQQALNYDQP